MAVEEKGFSFRRMLNGLSPWRLRALLVLVGALGVLGLPPFSFPPAFALSLSILFFHSLVAPARSWKAMALDFWAFGFGFFLAGLYWIGYSFLVDAETFAWMLPFVAVLMPSGLALFFALAGLLCHLSFRLVKGRAIPAMFLFVLALGATEWLRGNILTGFPWNLPGYVWADHLALAQMVYWLGIYGLSLLTLLWAVLPALTLLAGWRSRIGGVALAVFLLIPAVFWGMGEQRLKAHPTQYDEGVALRLVQPNVPQAEKWLPENRTPNFEKLLLQSAQGDFGRVTHVIWPESATPFLLDREERALSLIGAMLGKERLLITGYPRFDVVRGKRQLFNSVGSVDGQGKLTLHYDKQHLVPFGEYLPMADFLGAIGLQKLTAGREGYSPGTGERLFSLPGVAGIRPLICYEVIFANEVFGDDPEHVPAGLLLNLTNDAWFGDSTGPYQHLAMTRMRAIENGLPLIRVANTGISAVFDPVGRQLAQIPLNESGILDITLPRPLKTNSHL